MIVIAKKVDRLANRIVLFAHFLATAADHRLVVVNSAFHEYAHCFPATAGDLLCRYPRARGVPPFPGGRRILYGASLRAANALHVLQRTGRDVGLIRLTRDQQLDLGSEAFLGAVRRHRVLLVQDWFFRNPESCARHRDLVRAFFTPHRAHLDRAAAIVERVRRTGRPVVGVHIRRTDYERFKDGRFFYSYGQYRRVMAHVQEALDREVSFLVCSDAAVPAEPFRGLDVFPGSGHALEDLYALARCDRLVGPPSTYGAWGVLYGDVPRYVMADRDRLPDPVGAEPPATTTTTP